MVDAAVEEDRVILSCDKLFFRRRLSRQAYLVQGQTKQQQVNEVMQAFELTLEESSFMSRCGKCNGKFLPRWVNIPGHCHAAEAMLLVGFGLSGIFCGGEEQLAGLLCVLE